MPLSQNKSDMPADPFVVMLSMYGYYSKKNRSIEIMTGGMMKHIALSPKSMIFEISIDV